MGSPAERRESQREAETDRGRDRQREAETDRERQRQTEIERGRQKDTACCHFLSIAWLAPKSSGQEVSRGKSLLFRFQCHVYIGVACHFLPRQQQELETKLERPL